jgi:hypothetical protein
LSRDSTNWPFREEGIQESGGSDGEASNSAEISRVYLTIECDSFNFNFNVAGISSLAIGLSTDENVRA